jgi:hypothetical protein
MFLSCVLILFRWVREYNLLLVTFRLSVFWHKKTVTICIFTFALA